MSRHYQTTELGIIPADWNVVQIGDISSIVTNGFVGTASIYHSGSESGVIYIQGYNIRENRIDLTGVTFVTQEFSLKQQKSILQHGDLLTVQSGHIGTTAVVPRELVGSNCHALIITRLYQDRAEPHFIAYYLNYVLDTRLRALQVGSSILHINTSELKKFSVPLPPLPEQRAIAAILGTWDAAIALTGRLIDALKRRKQALMQLLLTGEVRFPEFEGEAWEEKSVKEMGRISSGGTPDTNNPAYWNGEIFWCTPTDITALQTKYLSTTPRTITPEGLKNSSATLLSTGSVVVCTRATVGEAAVTTVALATNQGFKNITPNPDFDPEYLYYLITVNKHRLIQLANGSTFLELSKTAFEGLSFEVPQYSEQTRIAEMLGMVDQEIETLSHRNEIYKTQKRGLMQRLLTGQVRV